MRIATLLASLALVGTVHASEAIRHADRLMQKYTGDAPGATLLVLRDTDEPPLHG